jgi:hypothetical protein
MKYRLEQLWQSGKLDDSLYWTIAIPYYIVLIPLLIIGIVIKFIIESLN